MHGSHQVATWIINRARGTSSSNPGLPLSHVKLHSPAMMSSGEGFRGAFGGWQSHLLAVWYKVLEILQVGIDLP